MSILDRFSGQAADNLENQLQETRDQIFETNQETANQVATIKSRTKAKLDWIDKKEKLIREKYMELAFSIDSGDQVGVNSAISLLREVGPAVLSMEAFNSEGESVPFKTWLEEEFDDKAQGVFQSFIRQTCDKYGLTPDFEKITSTNLLEKPVYDKVERSLVGKFTGNNIEALENKLRRAKSNLEIAQLEQTIETSKAERQSLEQLNSKLREINDQAKEVFALIKLDNAIQEEPATARKTIDRFLPYLVENQGFDAMYDWFMTPEDGYAPRIIELLNDERIDLSDKDHPLYGFMAVFADSFSVIKATSRLMDMNQNEAIAGQLEKINIEAMVAHIKTAESDEVEELTSWFMTAEDGASAPIMKLLNDKSVPLADPDHPLHAYFAVLPNSFAAVETVMQLQAMNEDPDIEVQLDRIYIGALVYHIGKTDEADLERMMTWFMTEQENGEIPVLTLLHDQTVPLEDPAHPLRALLDKQPNRIHAVKTLAQLASMTEDEDLKKQLKLQEAEQVGDYIRPSETSIFNPALMGSIEVGSERLLFNFLGQKVDMDPGLVGETALIDYLDERQGFAKLSANEIVNDKNITKSFAVEAGDEDVHLWTDYFGIAAKPETLAKETADSILSERGNDSRFVKLGDGTLIDKTKIDHAWISRSDNGYTVSYVLAGQIHEIENLNTIAEAEDFLTVFAEDENSIYLSDTEIVKVSKIGNVWIGDQDRSGMCRLEFVIKDSDTEFGVDMPTEQALSFLNRFVGEYGHIPVGRAETINPAVCEVIHYDSDENLLHYSIGGREDCSTEMNRKLAKTVLKEVEKQYPEFLRHQQWGLMNPDKLGRIEYSDDTDNEGNEIGVLRYMLGDEYWGSVVERDTARDALRNIAQRPHFKIITDNILLNMNKVGFFEYNHDEHRLEWGVNGVRDKKCYPEMSESAAKHIVNEVDDEGKALARSRLQKTFDSAAALRGGSGGGASLTDTFNEVAGVPGPKTLGITSDPTADHVRRFTL